MKKTIIAIMALMMIATAGYAQDSSYVSPGVEFSINESYVSLDAIKLYAVDDDTVTAAGYNFRPTSATFFLTDRLATHTTSFLWDEISSGDGNTIENLINWGNGYKFRGLKLYYTAIATEVASFQMQDDSCTIIITGGVDGLAQGTSSYILASFTLEELAEQIVIDRYTAGVGSGTWTIVADNGDTESDDLTDQGTPIFNVTGTKNALRVPVAGYDAAGAGWVFSKVNETSVYDLELSTNLMVGIVGEYKSDTTTLGTTNEATIAYDVRRYLNYDISMVGFGGKSLHLVQGLIAATFSAGTTNSQIFEGATQVFPNNSITTVVVDEMDFANDVFIGTESTTVSIRVDSGADGSITSGFIKLSGFRR